MTFVKICASKLQARRWVAVIPDRNRFGSGKGSRDSASAVCLVLGSLVDVLDAADNAPAVQNNIFEKMVYGMCKI